MSSIQRCKPKKFHYKCREMAKKSIFTAMKSSERNIKLGTYLYEPCQKLLVFFPSLLALKRQSKIFKIMLCIEFFSFDV